MRFASAAALAAIALAACGGSVNSVRDDVLRGFDQIRTIGDDRELSRALAQTMRRLRRAEARDGRDRRAKELALSGFELVSRGLASRIAFKTNDSGNVEAATRDAKHAYAALTRGRGLLQAAADLYGKAPSR